MERKCAIVTGASSGIGAAIAERLASRGCDIIVNFNKNNKGGNDTVINCQKKGVKAIAVCGNIESNSDCKLIVETCIKNFGKIDILVNNSGVTRVPDKKNSNTLSADDFAKIFAVNVTGSYLMVSVAKPFLKKTKGSIINISSHSGFSGMGSSIAYAASKGALNTLTVGLARSLSPEIRVNAVCPGFVDTNWMKPFIGKKKLDDFKRNAASISPLLRIVTPEEVAEATCWFALGGLSITGQLLVIDGGTHLTINSPV